MPQKPGSLAGIKRVVVHRIAPDGRQRPQWVIPSPFPDQLFQGYHEVKEQQAGCGTSSHGAFAQNGPRGQETLGTTVTSIKERQEDDDVTWLQFAEPFSIDASPH